jgi:hypothetical protein
MGQRGADVSKARGGGGGGFLFVSTHSATYCCDPVSALPLDGCRCPLVVPTTGVHHWCPLLVLTYLEVGVLRMGLRCWSACCL